MKFLSDVHISYKTVKILQNFGYESIHVNLILDKWNTKDRDICKYADLNGFIVITKDSDFKDSFLINKTPKKLIKINLGNISNNILNKILSDNITLIKQLNLSDNFMIEIDLNQITVITK